MSAEVLREAASLMRSRAEADLEPGPWEAGEHIVWSNGGADVVSDGTRGDGGVIGPDHAEHIASWHPAVALAVADWLEAEATSMDALGVFTSVAATIKHEVNIRGASLTVTKGEQGEISLRADTSRPALAVARAYLGSAS